MNMPKLCFNHCLLHLDSIRYRRIDFDLFYALAKGRKSKEIGDGVLWWIVCVCVTVSKLKSDETFFKNPPLSCGRFFFLVVISFYWIVLFLSVRIPFRKKKCSRFIANAYHVRYVWPHSCQNSFRFFFFCCCCFKTINNNSHCKFQLIANWIDIQHVSCDFCFTTSLFIFPLCLWFVHVFLYYRLRFFLLQRR